jgi:hypothetical protein
VVVELEPQAQQQPPLEDAAGYRRIADRAEQDGVVLGELAEHRLRQQLAGRVPPRGTEVVGRRLRTRRDFGEHLQRLVDDLRPDAVAGNDRQAHAPSSPQLGPPAGRAMAKRYSSRSGRLTGRHPSVVPRAGETVKMIKAGTAGREID